MSHDASATTAGANSDVATRLNLEDAADLERVRHGRLGGLDRLVVRHDKHGQPILDTADWDFLDDATTGRGSGPTTSGTTSRPSATPIATCTTRPCGSPTPGW